VITGDVISAAVLSMGFVAVSFWRASSLLIAMHGKAQVRSAAPFGRLFGWSPSKAVPGRRYLVSIALLMPIFPLGFAFVSMPAAARVFLGAAAVIAAVFVAALWTDREIRRATEVSPLDR
jgi:hypothetical protein